MNRPLASAVLRLLQPLVRLLLRNGVPFGAFSDLARWVYVDVARREFGITGRKTTDSRIATLTGLTRKDVAHLTHLPNPIDPEGAERYHRAARVIAGWRREPRFQDHGEPAVLPIEGDGQTFQVLVRAFSGDVPHRAILDELLRVGAVSREADGRVRLLVPSYIPRGDEAQKLTILGTDVAHLIATIDHNLTVDAAHAWLQRGVSYDNLPAEALDALRLRATREGQALVESLDAFFAAHDRDANPAARGNGRHRAGIGVFYFEEDFMPTNGAPPAEGGRTRTSGRKPRVNPSARN